MPPEKKIPNLRPLTIPKDAYHARTSTTRPRKGRLITISSPKKKTMKKRLSCLKKGCKGGVAAGEGEMERRVEQEGVN